MNAPKAPSFDGTQPCVTTDPELWFPEEPPTAYHLKTVRDICKECTFVTACLDYAIRHDMQGIWAGTLPAERQRLAVALGIKPVSVSAQLHELAYIPAPTANAETKRRERARAREREQQQAS